MRPLMCPSRRQVLASSLLLAGVAASGPLFAAEPASAPSLPTVPALRPGAAPMAAAPGPLKVQRGMTVGDLMKLPDSQVLESPTGQRGTVADFKNLMARRKQKLLSAALNDGPEGARQRVTLNAPDSVSKRFAAAVDRAKQAFQTSRVRPVDLGGPALTPAQAEQVGKVIDLSAPRIGQVSGQPVSQTWFIPGIAYDIRGQGFGNTPGQVKLLGQFPNGMPTFRIELWTDRQIVATVDPAVTGAVDQNEVTLVVQPAAGPPLQAPHGHFWAARDTVWLDVPQSRIAFGNPGGITPTYKIGADHWLKVRRHFAASDEFFSTTDLFSDNFEGPLNGCNMSPSTDQFDLSGLKPEFSVVYFDWVHGRTDSGSKDADGDRGQRYFSPGYETVAGADGRSFGIKWGVFKSYYDPWTPPVPDSWWCNSNYRLQIMVQGPRGIAPW